MPPQAAGLLILVPFINCNPCRVHVGTKVIPPPQAEMQTPTPPSAAGARELHVYCVASKLFLRLYSANIIDGETNAPTPMTSVVVAPGLPAVLRAGPALPALLTKVMPYLLMSSEAISQKRPVFGTLVASP